MPRSSSGAHEFFTWQKTKESVRIAGDGYILREWKYTDCESLAKSANNVKIWDNVMDHFPYPYTQQDAFDYISMAQAMPGAPMRLAIEVGGKAVGSIGFGSEGDIERITAEVGYWLGEEYWGQGIMPKVLQDVVHYAFANFAFEKLFALVFDYNPASMRVLEKAGFKLEAVLHRAAVKNGKIIDFYYYSRMRDE